MKKIWLFGLLIVGAQGLFGEVVMTTTTQCYQICVSDGYTTACGISCDTVTSIYDDGTNNNGNNNDNNNNSGGGGGSSSSSTSGQKLASCWTELTSSERITSPFNETRAGSTCGFHTGVDIGTSQEGGKIPLYSGTSGTVVGYYYQSGHHKAGFYVKVHNDNGSYTVYSHLDGNEETGEFNNSGNIVPGMRVTVGMRLGTTDSSGGVDPHLDIKTYFPGDVTSGYASMHFGIFLSSSDIHYCSQVNRTYINSLALMGGEDCR